MAHRYQLFREVEARCRCCHRYERLTFTSAYDQVICPRCTSHVGDAPSMVKRRDAEHVTLWESDVASWRQHYEGRILTLQASLRAEEERHAAEITSLNEKVSDLEGALQADLATRPVESIAKWFEGTKIAEAEERLDRSRKFIARLFGVLWNVDGAHNRDEGHDDRCWCGLPEAKCRTLAALDPIRNALYKWEAEEVQRIRNGKRHDLPDEHPEVLKHEPWRAKRPA